MSGTTFLEYVVIFKLVRHLKIYLQKRIVVPLRPLTFFATRILISLVAAAPLGHFAICVSTVALHGQGTVASRLCGRGLICVGLMRPGPPCDAQHTLCFGLLVFSFPVRSANWLPPASHFVATCVDVLYLVFGPSQLCGTVPVCGSNTGLYLQLVQTGSTRKPMSSSIPTCQNLNHVGANAAGSHFVPFSGFSCFVVRTRHAYH